MPRTALLVLLAVLAPRIFAAPPEAARDLTVDQFEQLLAGLHHWSDAKAARQIAGLRLAERANADELAKWQAEFPGDRAREALVALVDASAFLRPPAAEILSAAPSGTRGDKEMLALATDFAKEMLPKLPNFYALRSTTSFEVAADEQLSSLHLTSGALNAKQPKRTSFRVLGPAGLNGSADQKLFWTGSFAETVTYRDGAEVEQQPKEGAERQVAPVESLTTWGEFGPILRVVLEDAPIETTVLDRWEKGPHGPLAVFRYRVPGDRSHLGMLVGTETQFAFPAYDGEFTVDAATGAILRITIRTAESEAGYVARAFITVEFGPTKIAGVDYICPTHGVAMVKYFDPYSNIDTQPPPLAYRTSINDIAFSNYHVFRTKARIIQ